MNCRPCDYYSTFSVLAGLPELECTHEPIVRAPELPRDSFGNYDPSDELLNRLDDQR